LIILDDWLALGKRSSVLVLTGELISVARLDISPMVLIEVVQLVVYINWVCKVIFGVDDQLAALAHRWVGVSDRASRKSVLPFSVSTAARDWVALTIILQHLFPDLPARDE